MLEFKYVITDDVGIHARPAGLLVKTVKEMNSPVTLTKNGKTVDAGKLMAIMSLGVKKGDEITVAADNEEALKKMEEFFRENL